MRVANVILGAVSVGAVLALSASGCGSSSSTGTGASTTTSNGTTNPTTTSSGSTSSGSTALCEPGSSCKVADKTCLGLVDNTGLTKFGLRMSELDVTSPKALTAAGSPIIAMTVSGAVYPDDMACNEGGTGTFNWLLQFDTTAKTLTTGGAKPVMDPTMGYSFDNEMIAGQQIAPIVIQNVVPDATGAFTVTMGQSLNVPIFLDSAGKSAVVLPLQQARLKMGTLSSNNNCIGTFNAAGLDPASNCMPDPTHPLFNTAASLDGFITLKDADGVYISALQESLCVLLSGSASTYGTSGMIGTQAATVCKKDSMGNIMYQGGWCSTTNSAGGCADSEQLAANFAASSVKIN